MFKRDKMPSARGQECKKVHGGGTFYKKSHINKGFSLVELIVVIAILVVFAAILIPSLLQYTENSRAQKDVSAMDEVVNAMQLALADEKCFDEVLKYSCTNNYITYSDSSGNYGQQIKDGEFWAPDGSGRAVTITFNPEYGSNNEIAYNLSKGIVNDMTYGNGSVAENRVMEGAPIVENQCYFVDLTETYNMVRQTVGNDVITTSQTYRNSSYTIFIKFSQKDSTTVADVDGSFNGTNLYEGANASLGSGTSEYDSNGDAITTVTRPGTTTSQYTNSDLQGGGTASYKDKLPCGHSKESTGNHDRKPCGHYECAETQCSCQPATCGIEGHWDGDGKDHTKIKNHQSEYLVSHHYACECEDFLVPEGCYYVRNNITYNAGEIVPCSAGIGATTGISDIFYTQDYIYTFNNGGSASKPGGGWYVNVADKTKTEYEPLYAYIRSRPVLCLNHTFTDCTNLITAPEIPNTVVTMYGAFSGCSSLINAPKIPSSVSLASGLLETFMNCTSLVTPPDLSEATNVKSMEYTFKGCTSLTSLPVIPDSVTSVNGTFYGCSSLVDASGFTTPAQITSWPSTFYNCYALKVAPKIPETVTSLDRTFYWCKNLVTFEGNTRGDGDFTDFFHDGIVYTYSTFYSNQSMVTAPKIPDNISTMSYTFNMCSKMKGEIRLPCTVKHTDSPPGTAKFVYYHTDKCSPETCLLHTSVTAATCGQAQHCDSCGLKFGTKPSHSVTNGVCTKCNQEVLVIETTHKPHQTNVKDLVLGTWDFPGATSVDIHITYRTQGTSVSWAILQTGNKRISDKGELVTGTYLWGGRAQNLNNTSNLTATLLNVDATSGSVIFTSKATTAKDYYGIMVQITPNYD